MKLTEKAKAYLSKIFSEEKDGLEENDPEFAERFYNFAFDEVVNQGDMDDKTRMLAILATLTGCQGTDAYRVMAKAALRVGVTPVEIKEVTYQAVAYLGIGIEPSYQPLAGRQLLWRLLHEKRAGLSAERNDHILLYRGTGWL